MAQHQPAVLAPLPRHFRSRRWALAKALASLWLACDVAASGPQAAMGGINASADATGEDVTANDLAALADAIGG